MLYLEEGTSLSQELEIHLLLIYSLQKPSTLVSLGSFLQFLIV
jgi:hypothetical protein